MAGRESFPRRYSRDLYLKPLRERLNKFLKDAITLPLLRTSCVEEIIMLAESMMTMHDMLRSDIRERPTEMASAHLLSFDKKIAEWWEATLLVADKLNNEAVFKYLIYRFLLEGMNALCALCSVSGKSVARQLFKTTHKRQAMLSRVNLFVQAVIEAYSEQHMIMRRKELDKQLKPLHITAAWLQRRKIRPTKETIKNACWNCNFLLNKVLKEYSWKGIKLLDECKVSKEAHL